MWICVRFRVIQPVPLHLRGGQKGLRPAVTFPTSMHGLDPPWSPGPGPLQTQPLRLRSPPGAGGNACVEKLRTLPRVCTRLVKQQATSSGPPRLGISSLQSSHLRGIRFARSWWKPEFSHAWAGDKAV